MALTKESVESAAFEPDALPTVSVAEGAAASWKGDVLAVGIFEDALAVEDDTVTITDSALSSLDKELAGIVTEVLEAGDFKGKKGNSATLRLGAGARYVTLLGLGKAADAADVKWGPSAFQAAGSALASACKSSKAKTAAVALFGGSAADELLVQGITYGVLTGAYESTRFKSDAKQGPLECVTVLVAPTKAATRAAAEATALAKGNLYCRWLVEAPPNVCTPTYLAASAQAIAAQFPDTMSCTVLERADCEAMGMGCFLGVAECSEHPPKFIHLTYKPKGKVKRKVAIVGKGLTFDAGGYNIKAGAGSMIELMKFDMGGAGATFGAARAIAEIAPAGVEVHFISAACENMIDGKGMRPGDILVSAAGATVEVGNTDAEGRLTLCDALWYVQEKVGASKCIDIATLTGAQIIALGTGMGAVLTPLDSMADEISAAGLKPTGEKWWRLPMEDAYFEQLKSSCADLKNVGGRAGGTITAGLFLKHFVNSEVMEWAHLDIAGPVWDEKLGGATGFGATTLATWAIAQGK